MRVLLRTICVLGLAWTLGDGWISSHASAAIVAPPHVVIPWDQISSVVPMIAAGDPAGSPPDNPAFHVDPNSTSSTYAGVGSLLINEGSSGLGICSGCAIHGFTLGKTVVRDYILTAAHCLDFAGGTDEGSRPTGDGTPDVAPQNVTFVLNYGGNITSQITASEIHLFPDWHGFDNVNGPEGPSINDDVALIRLSQPLPVGVPTYNLSQSFSGNAEGIINVGYGESGSPAGGYVGETLNQFLTIKRVGHNHTDAVFNDDEGAPNNSNFEGFEADFDGPTSVTNVFDIGSPGFVPSVEGTLGNNVETTIGPGDSGSPAFLSDFDSPFSPTLGADGQPIVYGIDIFTANGSPAFGSVFGGTLVSRYASWIDTVIHPVPEPSSIVLMICGVAGFGWLTRLASRKASI